MQLLSLFRLAARCLLVLIRATSVQAYLQTDAVASALSESKCVLNAITVLKKICDHPALLTNKAASLALTAGKHGPRRRRQGAGASDSEDSSYDSLGDFIADDTDEESGSDAESAKAASSRTQDVMDVEGQIQRIGESLGQEFKDIGERELLEKLHNKSVKESCKTVRAELVLRICSEAGCV
jgi:DNA excision repair protein ERCC-6-like